MLATPFIGRTPELDTLKECWHRARRGKPQVINLIADTGVGKTRIVHAFYEWLSTDPSQHDGPGKQGYWPDNLGTSRQRSANPSENQFSAFDFEHDYVPWLWWGMYWTDVDGEQTVALNQFYDIFANHLKMLEVEQKVKRSNWKAVAESLLDEGLDIAADFAPGVTQAKNLFGLFTKIQANRNEKKKLANGLSSGKRDQLKRIEDDIFQRLGQLYKTKDAQSSIPIVLFLDDIHFATDKRKDAPTLNFLDALLRQAAIGNWPLLVITTHWEAPWREHLHGVVLEEGKPWRRIINELQAPGKENKALYSDEQIKNIELDNIEPGELERIIKATLPGLSDDNRKLMLDRVDNVRWLVELLTALNDNVDNFINQDRQSALSNIGLRRLDELLRSSGYLDVIRQRLSNDAMSQTRPLLGAAAWHSHDLEFIGALTEILGLSLIEQQAVNACDRDPRLFINELITKAIDPSAVLEGVFNDNQQPGLLRFPERGYLEVAQHLFDESHLPPLRQALAREIIKWLKTPEPTSSNQPRWQQLPSDNEKRVFLEIAHNVLGLAKPKLTELQREKLKSKEEAYREMVSDGDMTEETLLAKLEEARQKLLDESQSSAPADIALWHRVSTIELIHWLRETDESRAYQLSAEVVRSNCIEEACTHVNFDSLITLGQVLTQDSSYWNNVTWIFKYLNLKATQLSSRMESEYYFDLKIRLLRAIGDFYIAQDDYESAVSIYENIEVQFENMMQNSKVKSNKRLEYVEILTALAQIYRSGHIDLNDYVSDIVLEKLSKSFYICDKIIGELGENAENLWSISNTVFDMASLDYESAGMIEDGHHVPQPPSCNYSIDRYITKDFPEYNYKLSAYRSYERCLKIRERIIEVFGETPSRLSGVAEVVTSIARCQKESSSLFNKAISIYQRVIRNFGETAERIINIAEANNEFSLYLKKKGNYISSQQFAEKSILEYQRVVNLYGNLSRPLRGGGPV